MLFFQELESIVSAGCLQPDWFKESMDGPQPLLVARNVAYSQVVKERVEGMFVAL